MNTLLPANLRNDVIAMCARIGTDPLLVQGAGGNVSWKDGDTLWIKASGTWLADAAAKDIFVPVDLAALRGALAGEQFDATPTVLGASTLRPSIETLLHALMPHPVVVHVHAIDVLAHLVRSDCAATFSRMLDPASQWALVQYRKPGAELAGAVAGILNEQPADIVFLQNHGVVIGAASPPDVMAILHDLTQALATEPAVSVPAHTAPPAVLQAGSVQYAAVTDPALHALALDTALFARVATEWALYPDHVVFLGAHAFCYPDVAALSAAVARLETPPPLVFIEGTGVYTTGEFGMAKQAQLRCYFDVIVRQDGHGHLAVLSPEDIGALLNWDAERYRQSLSKK